MSEFSNKLKDKSSLLGINLSENELLLLDKFKNKLLEWNEKINLTTIIEEDDIITKHFIDSIIPEKFIENNAIILDLGTGAGFPGIPLKIIREDLNITLLDAVNKKIIYLEDVISKLELKNIKAIHSRVEEFGQEKKNREKYDIVIARAVANMSTLVEYMLPLVKVGGKAICMKGPNVEQELDDSKNAIVKLGGCIENVVEYYNSEKNDVKYTIVIIKKVKETDKCYPRKAGTPSKNPLRR